MFKEKIFVLKFKGKICRKEIQNLCIKKEGTDLQIEKNTACQEKKIINRKLFEMHDSRFF